MRFLIASLAIGFLAVGPAAAQEKMTIHEYVDAHRPKIEKRPLTADEKAAFNRLSATLKKTGTLTEAQLDELRPLANTGDLNVMRTMFEGVRSWSEVKTEILGYSNYGPGNADAFRALSGLWAVMLWREGERSPKLAQEIDYCLGAMKIKWSRVEGKLCGFSATFDGDYEHDITRYGDGKEGAKPPRSAVFDEWPMAPKATPEEERARFEALLAAYRRGETNKDSA